MISAFAARWSTDLLLTLFIGPVFAAAPKPDAAVKTKSIEANVFLDDRIKADPALAASCSTRMLRTRPGR